jgi:hexosaminidase
VEALGIEGRRNERKYSSLVPLNRLVDAARPESETVRRLEQCARRIPADPAAIATLRATFQQWTANHSQIAALALGNFLVSELLPLSEELKRAGTIGLEALDYLQSGKAAPENWIAEQKRILDSATRPKAEVVLSAARPVRTLLDLCSKGSSSWKH